MSVEDFNFDMPIQIRWNDLDPLGHVNNAVFVTYFELGRSLYMPAASKKWDWYKQMFLIGEITVTYRKELKIGAKSPRVHVKTTKLGTKSFVLTYCITSKDSKDEFIVHAFGTSTQIMFDTKEKTTIPIQEWLRKDLQEFDNLG